MRFTIIYLRLKTNNYIYNNFQYTKIVLIIKKNIGKQFYKKINLQCICFGNNHTI